MFWYIFNWFNDMGLITWNLIKLKKLQATLQQKIFLVQQSDASVACHPFIKMARVEEKIIKEILRKIFITELGHEERICSICDLELNPACGEPVILQEFCDECAGNELSRQWMHMHCYRRIQQGIDEVNQGKVVSLKTIKKNKLK